MTKAMFPMPPFDWQQHQWDEFCARAHNGNLPHAFLLSGCEGIGIEQLATTMARYLLCRAPLKNMTCGKCRGCQLNHAATHPDLLSIFPDEKGKQIKIDQVRDIAHRIDQTAQFLGYKIIIINPAEAMNINAANALLKNLEEPAGKTIFFLVTHHLNRVLPTIRSRCSRISLASPSHNQALAWLRTQGVDHPERLLHDAMGAPLLAKQWHDDGTAENRLKVLEELVKISDRELEPMVFAQKRNNIDPMQVLQQMLICTELLLAHKLAGRAMPEHYELLRHIGATTKAPLLFRLRDRLCARKAQLLNSPNLNVALFIEELALDWAATVKEA